MNSHKVVTVCSSDTGYPNSCNNLFQSHRRSWSRGERQFVSKDTRARIRSAPLSSVLKSVSLREFRNNLPRLITLDQQIIMNNKRGSIDSDTLRKEIDTAVLLLESRNEVDMTPQYLPESRAEECHYKVHDRHQLTRSAQRTIEQRVRSDNPRWDSAKLSRVNHTGVTSSTKKCHLRMLSTNESSQKSASASTEKKVADDPIYEEHHMDARPNLIISSSNSLTNFITIDEIYGVKKYWIKGKEKHYSSTEDIKPPITYTNYPEKRSAPTKGRDDILRQYMDVYMHWRTMNAIEEHDHIVSCTHRDSKSAKIRYATPKERLEQFKNSINDRQTLIRRKSSLYVSGIAKERLPISESVPLINVSHEPSILGTDNDGVMNDDGKDAIKEIPKIIEDIIEIREIEKDPNSDAYSEIDWLECEDI